MRQGRFGPRIEADGTATFRLWAPAARAVELVCAERMPMQPEGDGWFVKIKMSDPSQLASLMDEAGYKEFVKGQE